MFSAQWVLSSLLLRAHGGGNHKTFLVFLGSANLLLCSSFSRYRSVSFPLLLLCVFARSVLLTRTPTASPLGPFRSPSTARLSLPVSPTPPLPLRPCPPSQCASVVISAGFVLNYAAACTWCYGLAFSPLILTVKLLWVWRSQGEGGGLFDLILTAETLYTTAVADKVGAARDNTTIEGSKTLTVMCTRKARPGELNSRKASRRNPLITCCLVF